MIWLLLLSVGCFLLAVIIMIADAIVSSRTKKNEKTEPIYDWRGCCKYCGKPKHDEVMFL